MSARSSKKTKRARVELDDDSDDSDEEEPNEVDEDEDEAVADQTETTPMSIIVRFIECPVETCNEKCKDLDALEGHLKAKHQIEKHRCLVRGCKLSFATQ